MFVVEHDASKDRPYWLMTLALLALLFATLAVLDGRYGLIVAILAEGLWITVYVALISFALAVALGLALALAMRSRFVGLRQTARFYIEVMRGLPSLVILLYVTFAATPALVSAYQWLLQYPIAMGWMPDVQLRDVSNTARGIFALALAYSGFLAEVFRAGLQSVPRSQIEAAQVLGLSRWLTFKLVIWPQATRRMLPVLGNDFICVVKDSSLVSVLGVNDITQLGKLYAASSFLTLETYNVVAALYLILTLGLSMLLRRLERHWKVIGQD